MHESNRLVSIIIPVYNRAFLITETLLSIKAQNYQNWEVVVVDDGSVDNTIEIVEKFCKTDERIRLYKRTDNPKGASVCRNIGLSKSKGEFVIFLDSDDLLAPNCLAQRLAVIDSDEEFDFVVSPQLVFYKSPGDSTQLINIKTTEPVINRFFTLCYCWDVPWINGAAIFRRESLVKNSIEWDIKLLGFQDVAFHLECIIGGLVFEYASCPPDVYCRTHTGERIGNTLFSKSVLYSTERMLLYFFQKLKNKELLTPELKERIYRTFFHAILVKWMEISDYHEADESLQRIREERAISPLLYFQMRFYVFLTSSFSGKFYHLRNTLFNSIWKNSIMKKTPENFKRHLLSN